MTPEEIYAVALEGGFSPEQAVTFTAIAMAESRGNPLANAAGSEDSRGLWQINVSPGVHENKWGNLYDPLVNARAAYEISREGTYLKPWSVTHAKHAGTAQDYRTYLDQARDAAAAVGSGGSHTELVPEPTDAGQADAGQAAAGQADAGQADAAAVSATPPQNGQADAGQAAAGQADAGRADAGRADAGRADAGQADAGRADTKTNPKTNADGNGTGVDVFLRAALNQEGDSYVFGEEARLSDPDPTTFDCSELVQWAAAQAGVTLEDGSWNQYLELQTQGGERSVEEAIKTPGALLFHFDTEPTPSGGRPEGAHVAISLGDGRTIEAANPQDGVEIGTAGNRFTHAAVIPQLDGTVSPYAMQLEFLPPPPQDTDQDGITDYFEQLLGTDATVADTDDDDLLDLYETTVSHTNPLLADTDADGRGDAAEVAEGADAGEHVLPDEVVAAGFGGAETADIDDDDLSDAQEARFGSDRTKADTDLDGVRDALEYAHGSDPKSIDTDVDGLTDVAERDAGTLGPRTLLPDASGTDAGGAAADPSAADPSDTSSL